MFKIRRPAIIGLLVVLLLFTSFLNYQLTQQSILKASKDYQEFELAEMEDSEDKDVFSEEILEDEYETVEEIEEEIDEIDENTDTNANNVEDVVYSRDKEIENAIDEEGDNYFVNFRLSRDKIRAEAIDRLDNIINNDMTEQTVRTEAQEEVINIGRIIEKELQIEGLIKSKGFNDSLVFLTPEDIKIVVSTQELSEEDMVKILDIVRSETDLEMDNVKIMKKH